MEIPRLWRRKEQRIRFKNLELNPVKKAGNVKNAISSSVEENRQGLFNTRVKIIIYEANPKNYDCLDDIKI
jgi:hypothetical protein